MDRREMADMNGVSAQTLKLYKKVLEKGRVASTPLTVPV
jgi:hypothetical protein